MAERGVEQLPGPMWAAVLMLSEASAGLPVAILTPAVAERKSASLRVRTVLLADSDIDCVPLSVANRAGNESDKHKEQFRLRTKSVLRTRTSQLNRFIL